MSWLNWFNGIQISPETLAIAACVLPGALVLTIYTRMSGIVGYSVNTFLLFAGAIAANSLMSGIILRIGFIQRVLLISVGGMLVVSLVMLLLFPRQKKG